MHGFTAGEEATVRTDLEQTLQLGRRAEAEAVDQTDRVGFLVSLPIPVKRAGPPNTKVVSGVAEP